MPSGEVESTRAQADCDAALKINPDSGKAYRVRGKARTAINTLGWGEVDQKPTPFFKVFGTFF